ncbi:hypothetical protein CIG66_12420 [Ralstonia pseudosolanacearum]|nr:hypothetical protein CIG66_12420 [Ralstonia pseudosolanacearum]
MTLITAALNGSNSRWFGGCVWTPPPRGRPSSLIQHCTHQQSRHWMHSWHTRTANHANLGSHPVAKQVLRLCLPYCALGRKDPFAPWGASRPRRSCRHDRRKCTAFRGRCDTPLFALACQSIALARNSPQALPILLNFTHGPRARLH